MVKFSIIIPVYNISSDYILKCINSIEEQKFKSYEIIIVNDGSDYETSTLLLTIEEKYNNIVVVEQKNAGVSSARNTGLKNANGEWILFIDPDDWVEKDSLSILDEKIDNSKDMVIFSYYDVIGEEKQKKTIKEINYISKIDLQLGLLDYRCRKIQCFFGAVWNCAYKKEMLIKNNIFFDEQLVKAEDTVFNLYAIEKSNDIQIVEEYLYCYRYNDTSLCHKFNPKVIDFMPNALLKIKEFIDYVDKWDIFEKSFYFEIMCCYNEMLKLYYLNAENDNKEKIKEEWKTKLSSPVFVTLKKRKFKAIKLLKKCKIYQLYLLAIYLRSFSLTKFAYKFAN